MNRCFNERFYTITYRKIIYKDEFFFIIKDGFPVNHGHLLIISNEIRTDYFDLTNDEKKHLQHTLEKAKQLILEEFKPDGFNIGMNCGTTAGQTIFHFHCHLTPRYKGDIENPRGGVRHVIPERGNY